MTAVLFLLRAAVLILLWGFVIAAIVAVRHDVFGSRRTAAAATRATRAPAPARKERSSPRRPAKSSAAGPPQRLAVVDGDLAGKSFPLGSTPITIGRAPSSTIVLSDDYVSTHHARLVPRGNEWVIEDLGSTNGTYLDRQRISAPTPVGPGMPIRIGKTVLELKS